MQSTCLQSIFVDPGEALGWVDSALIEDAVDAVAKEFCDDLRRPFQCDCVACGLSCARHPFKLVANPGKRSV
eukprot:1403783-Rhodomonas_salina.1